MIRTEYLCILMLFGGLTTLFSKAGAQSFVQVENLSISNPGIEEYWTGAAWADVDNDGDLDLFLTNRVEGTSPRKNMLFLNQDGNFVSHTDGDLVNEYGFWFGNSWGDVNNDGLIDVFVAGFPGRLYLNQDSGNFSRVNEGAIANATLSGIGTALGDLDQDGNLDIVLVRPNWIEGPPITGLPSSPHIMMNGGPPNYSFSQLYGTDVNIPVNDTYLQPTLSDFDGDNDLDLFIGMGSGASKPDLMYENVYADSAFLDFYQIQSSVLATDSVEGNQWSFADIDNDLDLDAYLTNWATVTGGSNLPRDNNLYINQPGGFIKIEQSPITSDLQLTTTVSWGDYDNDKDLDVIAVSDQGYTLKYYQNDGSGNFTSIDAGIVGTLDEHQSGASNGDFDNDGDLDLFVPGPYANAAMLRNDLSNGNNWVQFTLVGTLSNRSGIGAKIYLESGGMWQMREVSASCTFFGMNALRQHFGLGADTIEELKVKWPSGIEETFDSISINQFHTLVEGSGTLTSIRDYHLHTRPSLTVFPNPANGNFKVELKGWENENESGKIDVIDGSGKILHSFECKGNTVEIKRSRVDLKAGVYILVYTSNDLKTELSTKVIINQ